MTFPKGALPPVDRSRGGFWSLTMYDRDYFMLASSPNGRTNIGTVSLEANELKFGADGSLTLLLPSVVTLHRRSPRCRSSIWTGLAAERHARRVGIRGEAQLLFATRAVT